VIEENRNGRAKEERKKSVGGVTHYGEEKGDLELRDS
jgi:hypothetical protein